MKRSFAAIAVIALSAIALSAISPYGRTALRPGWNLFSHEEDIELGKSAQKQIEQRVHLVSDPELTRYISNLGKRLVAVAPYNDYPFSFHVVRDKSINAFALPGGPIYVNTGTIEQAENESQLAGVIAHEIGHIVLRHPTHAASGQSLARGGMAILSAVLGSNNITNTAAAMGLNPIYLRNSREAEKQADLMGAQILYDSGEWDPSEMARFFEKLEEKSGNRSVEFLSDHPNPGNRVQLVENEVATLGRPHRASDEDSEFPKMRRIAADIDRGIPAKESQSDGIAPPAQITASDSFKPYNGRGFRISYPSNWQVSEHSPVVNISPADAITSDGIIFGAMISYERSSNDSLDSASSRLFAQIVRENNGVRQDGASRHVMVGGLAGVSASLVGPSPQGGSELDWIVTAQRPDGTLWYIVFIANQRDYPKLRPVFQQMLDSVRLVN